MTGLGQVAPAVLVGGGAVGLALVVLTLAVLLRRRTDPQLLGNLRRGLVDPAAAAADDGQQGPTSALQSTARRVTTPANLALLERLWTRAGRPAAWPVERLVTTKLVLLLAALGTGLLYVSSTRTALSVLLTLGVSVVAFLLPELLLHSRAQERSQKITLELADTLDQMTIAVEAGLGFDAALLKAGRNGKGPLAEELIRTLQDMQVGQSRRSAYEALAGRTDVADLRRFVRAVIQADAFGIAVADVLRTQAAEMRMKRRQRAEEKAMQIPVKVIFPLMLCILPVLFIVLLGPAVVDIVHSFSG